MTSQPSDFKEQPEKIKKSRKKRKKVLIVTLCCFLAVFLSAISAVVIMWHSGKNGMTESEALMTPGDGFTAIINEDNMVVYKGKVYKYNDKIAAILCMGVDNDKKTSGGVAVTGRAGQADSLYLMAVDTSTGKTTVVGIPRDTLVDVDIYSKSGSFIGVENTQICLAYAYGDGKELSCENTVKAASRLLYGMPINSYFAVDNKSVPALHNAVGTITVVPNETIDNGVVYYEMGVPVKLTGSNVFAYLQARNQKSADASYLRMQRQLDYIKKYSEAAIRKTKENVLFPVELYNKIQKNAVTNIDVSRITYLTSVVVGNKNSSSIEFISIEGEQVKGEDNYAEFLPDEEKLFETVLKVYYTEVN